MCHLLVARGTLFDLVSPYVFWRSQVYQTEDTDHEMVAKALRIRLTIFNCGSGAVCEDSFGALEGDQDRPHCVHFTERFDAAGVGQGHFDALLPVRARRGVLESQASGACEFKRRPRDCTRAITLQAKSLRRCCCRDGKTYRKSFMCP